MNYTALKVGENEYKLRLDTKNTGMLEKVVGTNPVNEIMKMANSQLPSTTFVAHCLNASMQKYHHGVTLDKVYGIMDNYYEKEDKNLMDFIPVLMEVFQIAGLLPRDKGDVDEIDPK